jgi:hypothetical protein
LDPDVKFAGKGRTVDLNAIAAVTDELKWGGTGICRQQAAIRAVRRVSLAIREGKDPASVGNPRNGLKTLVGLGQHRNTTKGGPNSATAFKKNVFK